MNQTALQAYAQTNRLASSPTDVFLTLNGELISLLNAARTAHGQNRLDNMCRDTQQAMRIMLAIIGAFDPKNPNIENRRLCAFYGNAIRTISRILSNPSADKEFHGLIEQLQLLVKGIRHSQR